VVESTGVTSFNQICSDLYVNTSLFVFVSTKEYSPGTHKSYSSGSSSGSTLNKFNSNLNFLIWFEVIKFDYIYIYIK
jgi:hypothetical protein